MSDGHQVDSTGENEWEMMERTGQTDGLDASIGDIMKDLMTNVPGIDEAMAFAELMKMVILVLLSYRSDVMLDPRHELLHYSVRHSAHWSHITSSQLS